MRTRTKGIRVVGDDRIIEKQYKGERIFQRLGKVSQGEAEAWLRARQATIDGQRRQELRRGSERLFADGAGKYLIECAARQVRTLDTISNHIALLLPFIGKLSMADVCNEALEAFKDERILEDKVKNATVNLVRLAGFEPTTPWFVAKYSIQLSYSREASEYIASRLS
jgi:hypothetical protein